MKTFAIAAVAAVLLAPGLASAADVSGAWKLKVEVADMSVPVNCDLVQAASALSGTCARADGGDAPSKVTGTANGNDLEWAYDVDVQGQSMHVVYKGQLQADGSMKGALEVAGITGTFTGAK